MTWKHWLYGLGAALVGGAATSAGGALGAMVAGVDVFTVLFWKIVGGAVIFGGISNAVAYLRRSPLPSALAGIAEQRGSSASAPIDNSIPLPPVPLVKPSAGSNGPDQPSNSR